VEPLIRYSELRPVLDRVVQGTCTEADIALIKQVIREGLAESLPESSSRPGAARDEMSVQVGGDVKDSLIIAGQGEVRLGKYSVSTQDSGNIKIGQRVYKGSDSEAIRGLVRQVLDEMTADTKDIFTPVSDPAIDVMRLRAYETLRGRTFTLEDLEDLAFRLNVNWDELAGDTKTRKARALVRYFEQRGWLERLCQAIDERRLEGQA
jgi:hypothetical protein